MKKNPFSKFLTTEDSHHIQVANYIKDKLPDIVAFHVPSESKKSAFERYKHSLFGNLKGICDFVFLYPKFANDDKSYLLQHHGLLIELKAPEHNKIVQKGKDAGKIVKRKGVLSKEQEIIIAKLNEVGYRAVCCYGADEAIKEIEYYFKEYLEKKKQERLSKFKKQKT